ncbi:MAG: hypothetical protein JWP03_1739 [Phycisphaerales bacterium]|nr:hypothetical protein [Phycisphaerales bacterium]
MLCPPLRRTLVISIFLAIFAAPAFALESDQIALIVNSNIPAGKALAEFYAAQRHIPDGRIIEVALPVARPSVLTEDLPPADYDNVLVPAIRGFLTSHHLEKKVTCLVTFWGVPLRVDRRTIGEAERKEGAELDAHVAELMPRIQQRVKDAEALVGEIEKEFHAGEATDLESLSRRADAAINAVLHKVAAIPDPKTRTETFEKALAVVGDLGGKQIASQLLAQPEFMRLAAKVPGAQELIEAREHGQSVQANLMELQRQAADAATRAKIRQIVRDELGMVNYARLLHAQLRSLDTTESEAAVDSELSMLWWPQYPKARWAPNMLQWRVPKNPQALHTLMVMRLDGPTERSVHDLIEASIKVERDGLTGQVALDARGKPPSEPYGVYDQTIRNLAELLKTKTKLKVTLDDREPLFPAHSLKDIAVYCGWYSLQNYIPPGQFNAGAVAFHVASSELVSLHKQGENGWCRGLMNDGVAATLGPVAEPYLQSFPPADEFFPLLMTGKLTLAEVYWKTCPWASWMQTCIGDPLYTPYKVNPPLKVEDLPEPLRAVVE